MFVGPSCLPSAPAGWYCVAFASELAVGTVLTRQLAGHDLVIYRGQSGQIGMVDALCPHLGGHLGQGRVEDDCIRCPFHGFCFGSDGACVRTGYGTRPPPRAKVRPWKFVEHHGMLLAWWHPEAAAPTWAIPEVPTDTWTPLRWHTFALKSHVQEIAENSVDIGHFGVVHGYEAVETLAPLRVEGAYLCANYAIKRPRSTMGMESPRVELVIHQFGLGYARVECLLPEYGMRTRQFVLGRPTENGQVELNIAMSIQYLEKPSRIHPLLAMFPKRMLTEWILKAAIREYASDVAQDVPIWQLKRYVAPPALAEGDGPIGAYRRWARQFYLASDTATWAPVEAHARPSSLHMAALELETA